jgi:hypothetical protein
MLYLFMQMYMKELSKSFKDIARSTEAAIKGESDYRTQVKDREIKMAEADGIEMDEEDIDQNVDILSESSPYKRKVDEDLKRTLKVMGNG